MFLLLVYPNGALAHAASREDPVLLPDVGLPFAANRNQDSLALLFNWNAFFIPGEFAGVFDSSNGRLIRAIHTAEEENFASEVGETSLVYVCSRQGHVLLIDASNGKILSDFRISTARDITHFFAVDRHTILLCNTDTISTWRVSDSRATKVFEDFEPRVSKYLTLHALDPKAQHLVSLDLSNQSLQILALDHLKINTVGLPEDLFRDKQVGDFTCMKLGAGRSVTITSSQGHIFLARNYENMIMEDLAKPFVKLGNLLSLAISQDANMVGVINEDGELIIIDSSRPSEPRLLFRQRLPLAFFAQDANAVAPDSKRINDAQHARIWFSSEHELTAVINDKFFVVDINAESIRVQRTILSSSGFGFGLDSLDDNLVELDLRGTAHLWNMRRDRPLTVQWDAASFYEKLFVYYWPITFDRSANELLISDLKGTIKGYSPLDLTEVKHGELKNVLGATFEVAAIAAVPDRRWFYCAGTDGSLHLIDFHLQGELNVIASINVVPEPGNLFYIRVSDDGSLVVGKDDFGAGYIIRWDGKRLSLLRKIPHTSEGENVGVDVSPDGSVVGFGKSLWYLGGTDSIDPKVVNKAILGGRKLRFAPDERAIYSIGPPSNHATRMLRRVVLTGSGNSLSAVLDRSWPLSGAEADDFTLLPAQRIAVRQNGKTVIYQTQSGSKICELFSFADGQWCVADPAGRFDASTLEEFQQAHWVVPNSFKTISPEVFSREFYEPRLLQRSLANERFRKVRSLSTIDILQPKVEITQIARGDTDTEVRVMVTAQETNPQGEVSFGPNMPSGVYDIRLYRNGQLVAEWPEPKETSTADQTLDETDPQQLERWRENSRVQTDSNGEATVGPISIALPQSTTNTDIEFTAYAFNKDRVRSQIARKLWHVPNTPNKKTAGRAFLLCVGVSNYETPQWNLQFAHADAASLAEAVTRSLQLGHQFETISTTLLTSPEFADSKGTPTKSRIHEFLRQLDGSSSESETSKQSNSKNSTRLKTTPDDLVILFLAGHGYTDTTGTFYFLPFDIGSHLAAPLNQTEFEQILGQGISSNELSSWIRKIDCRTLVLILDTCHSSGAIEPPGVKIGPFGSRGLGQLAYDKGMYVLAASQSQQVALELGQLGHGLLTYSLAEEGLRQGLAGINGRVDIPHWLQYGAGRVPRLFEDITSGHFAKRDVEIAITADANHIQPIQEPVFFNFRRQLGPEIELFIGGK